MRTIALRYTDKFAPKNGTIQSHLKIIEKKGYVWYGKMGKRLSSKVIRILLANKNPRFLLIHSGSFERYWLYIDKITYNQPNYEDFPEYYHNIANNFNTWFRVLKIELADKKVMTKCRVISSGSVLSMVSRASMSPYFIIDFEELGELNI